MAYAGVEPGGCHDQHGRPSRLAEPEQEQAEKGQDAEHRRLEDRAVDILVADALEHAAGGVVGMQPHEPDAKNRQEPAAARPEPLRLGQADDAGDAVHGDGIDDHQ